jgi:hypothetical protein
MARTRTNSHEPGSKIKKARDGPRVRAKISLLSKPYARRSRGIADFTAPMAIAAMISA